MSNVNIALVVSDALEAVQAAHTQQAAVVVARIMRVAQIVADAILAQSAPVPAAPAPAPQPIAPVPVAPATPAPATPAPALEIVDDDVLDEVPVAARRQLERLAAREERREAARAVRRYPRTTADDDRNRNRNDTVRAARRAALAA